MGRIRLRKVPWVDIYGDPDALMNLMRLLSDARPVEVHLAQDRALIIQ